MTLHVRQCKAVEILCTAQQKMWSSDQESRYRGGQLWHVAGFQGWPSSQDFTLCTHYPCFLKRRCFSVWCTVWCTFYAKEGYFIPWDYLLVCPAPQRFVFDSQKQFSLKTTYFISSAIRLEGKELIMCVSVLSAFYNSASGPLPIYIRMYYFLYRTWLEMWS